MPRKSESIKIEGTEFDRRRKLSESDKERIKLIRKEDGLSYSKIATMFGVSKRLVDFICNPEKYEIAKQQFKERRLDGRYGVSKDERNAIVREHRNYKQELFVNKKIK